MIIKLTQINDSKLGTKAAKEIVGTKLEDDKEWKKKFFANQKDLRDQLEDCEVGDTINVTMKQDGDYWNIVKIQQATEDEIANAKKYAKGGGKSYTKEASARRADGGSRGDDTNRSAGVYLAQQIIVACGASQGQSPEYVAAFCTQLADVYLTPYIKDGVVAPFPEAPKKMKKGSADPLAPPTE
jgi:hypothetical protein